MDKGIDQHLAKDIVGQVDGCVSLQFSFGQFKAFGQIVFDSIKSTVD